MSLESPFRLEFVDGIVIGLGVITADVMGGMVGRRGAAKLMGDPHLLRLVEPASRVVAIFLREEQPGESVEPRDPGWW